MTLNWRAWATPTGALVIGVSAIALTGLFVYLKYKNAGGAKQLGQDLIEGAADGAIGLTNGALAGISHIVGISAPDETLTDVDHVREVIGQQGFFEASKRAGAMAFFKAAAAGPLYYSNEGRHGLAAIIPEDRQIGFMGSAGPEVF